MEQFYLLLLAGAIGAFIKEILEDNKIKLSKTVKPGYNRLHRIDDKTLLGVIKGSQSANMLGELFIEQYAKDTLSSPEPEEIGKSPIMSTGINITLSSINEP